jgi:hypothetical protein
MAKPKYIQLKREKGYKKPDNTVVVSRPSKYGNPFRIGEKFPMELYKHESFFRSIGFTRMIKYSAGSTVEDAKEAVELYKKWLDWLKANKTEDFEQLVSDLRGKNLACWCKAGAKVPCHAKVLLTIVN